jgi:CheY-like chemotaxis protein
MADKQAPILVVDDEPGIRMVLSMALEDDGFTVETASNGREAMDHIAQRRPSLVLLDLQMPVMTGWEVLNELRDTSVDVPVVFMSAGYRVKDEAKRCGVAGYLAKPFELDALMDVVTRFSRP